MHCHQNCLAIFARRLCSMGRSCRVYFPAIYMQNHCFSAQMRHFNRSSYHRILLVTPWMRKLSHSRHCIWTKRNAHSALSACVAHARAPYCTVSACADSCSSSSRTYVCEQLSERALVSVSGADSLPFLQSILTNDMTCLHREDCADCLYSLILNNQGRVLHDLIVYKRGGEGGEGSAGGAGSEYWLECWDQAAARAITSLLTTYRLRRKVRVEMLGDEHGVWALMPPAGIVWGDVAGDQPGPSSSSGPPSATDASDTEAVTTGPRCEKPDIRVPSWSQDGGGPSPGDYILERDPRIWELGFRLVMDKSLTLSDVLPPGSILPPEEGPSYRELLYRLGVGEGPRDLPPAHCFPSESNADYLHGVSYSKGCYVGQELTARTYHTGVTRKRLMPLVFHRPVPEQYTADEVLVKNAKGRNLGKFRSAEGRYGLALLRFQHCSDGQVLVQFGEGGEVYEASTHTPSWWQRAKVATTTGTGTTAAAEVN